MPDIDISIFILLEVLECTFFIYYFNYVQKEINSYVKVIKEILHGDVSDDNILRRLGEVLVKYNRHI